MARVLKQTTVARDGMHNAFTDVVFWQDSYWVGYRKGTSHISLDGEVCLSVSVDRERFRESARIRVPGDNRDPKLIVMDDERLAMYFATWLRGYEKHHLQQYVTFSNDGFNWETPQPVYQPHWWLWRVTKYKSRYYSAAYTYSEKAPGQLELRHVDLLVSDDLLHWEVISTVEGVTGGETDIHFSDEGEAWLITRNAINDGPAYLSIAQPPYTSWETKPLNEMVHSPVLLEHAGKLYVAGRRNAAHDGPHFSFLSANPAVKLVPSLGIWEVSGVGLTPVLNIPASGDCAYPGLAKDHDGRILLSYYSEHAYSMGVVPERYYPNPGGSGKRERVAQNDIYFAEIELP